MIPLFDDPVVTPQTVPLPGDAEHVARCAYLAAVTDAQLHCDQRISSARADFILAECAAWEVYQAASDQAVRAWDTPADHAASRWFTPAAGTRPHTLPEE